MRLSRFEAILQAYGASPERWPERERGEALALAGSMVAAARSLAQARALDEALQSTEMAEIAVEPAHMATLHARIVATALPRIAEKWIVRWLGVDFSPAQLWPSVVGLVVATVLGFVVGFGGLIQIDSDQSDDVAVMPSLDSTVSGTSL